MSASTTTIVVEDGSGVAAANSYASVANASAYAGARSISSQAGYGAWAQATPSDQAAALVLASDYLDSRYAWFGDQLIPYGQGLQWPRSGAYDQDAMVTVPQNVVPPPIIRATCELAIKVVAGIVLLEDLDRGGHFKSQSVAGLSVSYEDGADVGTVYGITGLLKGLIRSNDRLPPAIFSGTAQEPVGFYQGMFDNPGIDNELEGDAFGLGPHQNCL